MRSEDFMTTEGSKAIKAAQANAQLRGESVGNSIDLLLGLMDDPASQANQMLEALHVDQFRLANALMEALERREPLRQKQPFTPEVKAIIEGARIQARVLGRLNIHSGHLLLSMLKEPRNEAGKALRARGVTYEMALAVAHQLDGNVSLAQLGLV